MSTAADRIQTSDAFDYANGGEVSRHRSNEGMRAAPPFNLQRWIEQNRGLLKPPVGNKLLFQDSSFIVMAVGGPNSRKDFHHDPSEEFFFQLEGDMVLKTVQDGRLMDVPIRQGEVFLLPAQVPHSPQRPAGSVGIVVERRRGPDELDGFSWYCEHCGHCLYLERVAVRNIETQLPEIFSRFYSSAAHRTCEECGTVMQAPGT
jgi:3-hydroxyanthranilate 3,4-dioxygenase